MYAIASLLDSSTDQEIRAVWQRIGDHCGLKGIHRIDLPHFSWLGADSYHLTSVGEILEGIAEEMTPFTVRCAGLGIFTGPRPVMYVSLVKDAVLFHWHHMLWEKTRPYAVTPSMLYDPSHWMPHITLAYHEAGSHQFGCALQDIVYTPLNLEFIVHNLSLIYQTGDQDGIHQQYLIKEGAEK